MIAGDMKATFDGAEQALITIEVSALIAILQR
jgi:hypothetical protein